jgi:hypothetical protein
MTMSRRVRDASLPKPASTSKSSGAASPDVAIAILTGANVYFVFRQSNDRPGHHDWPRYVHQHGDRGR